MFLLFYSFDELKIGVFLAQFNWSLREEFSERGKNIKLNLKLKHEI